MEAAAITTLLRNLAKMLADEYNLHSGVKAGVKYIQEELTSMQAALEAVSRAPPATRRGGDAGQLELWARKVRELAYDADDTVDRYLVRVAAAGHQPRPCWAWARRYKARRRIAGEIERIKKQVQEASDRRHRFSIPDAGPRPPATDPVLDPRLPLLYENAARLVGMGRSTAELIRLLSPQGGDDDDGARLRVVAVVGPGGIGKTTLANEVYTKLREKFDCGAFVSVSLGAETRSVLCSILRQVNRTSSERPEEWREMEIINRIREVLSDKRYFVVIDDIWDDSLWKQIRHVLVDNNHGSKIIATTRNIDVAKSCHPTDSVDSTVHKLQPLSVEDSKKLFYNKVFCEDRCPPEFKYTSEEILRRCAGLPLAIITIASLLKNKNTPDEWSNVCNSFNGELSHGVKDMQWILSLSYYDLPWEVKPCMLYLSMFPEDHKIEKDDLIWSWIGEGFIHAKQDRNLYEVGEDYFNELINKSMVEPVHVDAHGRVQTCRVHDIVLDFITSLSLEENFATINGQKTQSSLRRLSLQNSKDKQIIPKATTLSHVRSLAIFCHAVDLKLPLPSFQVLRVLDLEDCSAHNIEDICNLVHLRYLKLRETDYIEVPKQIENLKFLRTLDLKRTKIKELPSALVQLRQLVRLCVHRNTQLPNGIGGMESLEELSEVDTSKTQNLMEELGKLCKLRVLEVSLGTWNRKHKEPMLKCLCNLKELRTLYIFASDVSLDFMLGNDWPWSPPHLRRFTVCVRRPTGQMFSLSPSSIWLEFSPLSRLPNWINPKLSNLSELSITVNTLPQTDLQVLGALPALCSLDLHVVKACTWKRMEIFASTSADHAVAFRCLANLKLASRAAGLVFRRQAMPKLQALSLSFDVAETKYVHGDFYLGLEHLTSVKVVDIGIDCRCATPQEVLDAENAISNSINLNPSHPTLDMHRHFVREMPWDATIEIPKLEAIKEEPIQAGLAKIGPWGGSRGRPCDINMAPHRLESVTIRSGTVVGSLSFSYYDHEGQCHNAGPWGGYGGSEHKIHLEPSEFLSKISGTIGPYGALRNIVTSLRFITNTRSYGPYGLVRGSPFEFPVQRNGCIVGFFGRAGWFLDAIGVYVNLREEEDGLGKFGPWGGNGGKPRDIESAPCRLDKVTISSGTIIDSIDFSYTDHNGQYHSTGPWGGYGENINSIQLGPSEVLTGIFGSISSFQKLQNVITSLTFVTNTRSYGPFGKGGGTPFHIPMQSNGCIVGFFGRSGSYLEAIGVYTNHELEIRRQDEAAVARIGPWGGDGGRLHDITVAPHCLENLESVTIFSGTVIDSLEFLYRDQNGEQHTAGPWGGCGGNDHKIQLDPSESVLKVSGTINRWGGLQNVVTSLTLVTNKGTYGPFGTERGAAFHVPVQSNGRIVGFFAHGKNYIEAIGVYVRTL